MHRIRNRVIARTSLCALVIATAAAAGSCTSDAEWDASGAARQAVDSGDNSDGGAAQGEVSLLFALDAEAATLEPTDTGYELSLITPSDVLVFTDRPVRASTRMTADSFADDWAQMFGDDPPNGALSGVTAGAQTVDVPVELTTISRDGGTLGFSMSVLPGVEVGELPDRLERVSLFIDNVPARCSTTDPSACPTFIPFDGSY